MTVPVWITPISMVVYTVLLMLLTEFMRRHYRTSMWVWVVSLVTIPLWIINIPGDDWFRWAKNLSVILPLIFAGLGRIAAVQQKDTPFWRLMRKRWVRWTLYGIVFCNIAEATLRDMQMGNMMNALAGFILCVTMPFGDKYWKYDTSSHGEILSYTVPMWNFLYTTWNACFVYAEGHEFFASTCCILAAAELYPIVMRRPELYITGREVGNGFSELNDAEDQAERFQAQVQQKEAGDDEAMFYDADFVTALEHGLPPTAGQGIGIDRLVKIGRAHV